MESFDPDELITCPYEPVHRLLRKRMPYHLIKCRKNFNVGEFKTCPFNARHVVPKPEFHFHLESCSDKIRLTELKQKEGVKGNTEVPPYFHDWKTPQCTESWDDDNVTYVPPPPPGTLISSSSKKKKGRKREPEPDKSPQNVKAVSSIPDARLPTSSGEPLSRMVQYSLAKAERTFQQTAAMRDSPTQTGHAPMPPGLGRGKGRGVLRLANGSSSHQEPFRSPGGLSQFTTDSDSTSSGVPSHAAASPPVEDTSSESPLPPQPQDKDKVEELWKAERKLNKMLRQIYLIEQSLASGEELNIEQMAKLERKEDILFQLKRLQLSVATA